MELRSHEPKHQSRIDFTGNSVAQWLTEILLPQTLMGDFPTMRNTTPPTLFKPRTDGCETTWITVITCVHALL